LSSPSLYSCMTFVTFRFCLVLDIVIASSHTEKERDRARGPAVVN
jgi:hypothetical protein